MAAETLDPRTVRPSPIAGTWYPGTRSELERTVDDLLASADHIPASDELIGLVVPHAGYPYSGQTAAFAYRQLEGLTFDLVVLLGPSHYEDYGPQAVSAKNYYATPLGTVPLAQDVIQAVADRVPLTRVEHDREHSLEIQLPFLQRMLTSFQLVPLMLYLPIYLMGPEAVSPSELLGAAIAQAVRGRRVLLVASSDLSHLYDDRAVERFDAHTAELVQAMDLPGLEQYMWKSHECRACGDAAIVALLSAAKQLGADRARVFKRTNSSEVTGSHIPGQYAVGYMAAGVFKSTH
ncbi:MAG: AmmeMemoRadiSam system protein B [Chloroflexi bacterium]|nr:AmmeMemoRadiSam system protein B [Chloroflexota bacterium]